MNKKILIPLLVSYLLLIIGCSSQKSTAVNKNNSTGNKVETLYTSFQPGQVWNDTEGNVINAHGGGILFANGKYYWFGEKRGMSRQEGVTVYSSKDLYNWKFESLALAPKDNDSTSDIARGCLMERPKVIYNSKTKKYVMWFHLELKGQGYKAARVAVASSDKVTGPYQFIKSFRPNDNMSRDMNLFVDDNGAAYHIYSSRENYDLRLVQLTDDFLGVTAKDSMLFSKHREAPALFKYESKYYLITSAATGWRPNKATMHVSTSLYGPWQLMDENPMVGPKADSTFGGQSTYVLPVTGKKNEFIFIADKWNPRDLKDSRYLWLPIQFRNSLPYVEWLDKWDMKFFDRSLSKSD